MIRPALAIAALLVMSGAALADASCKSQSATKGLHGAAETSFLTKCRNDASARCDADVKARKLHGAAATSFRQKCISDAAG